jgi:pantoate--beta-alanine ligase
VQTLRHLSALRNCTSLLRREGKSIALVPTMGALHDGHMALVNVAMQHADAVVVSIFVNPKQFGPNEDFDAYPRPEDRDAAMLNDAGVAVLWAPTPDVVYPAGFATTVSVAKLGDGLCGAARPGHFDGVATVVAKLFSQIQPDMAVFGEKDWQQLAIIRRMTLDLDLPVKIVGVPTLREADGLALSSRNAYLTTEQREAAVGFPAALVKAVHALEAGQPIAPTIDACVRQIVAAGFDAPDYVSLVDAASLEPLKSLDSEARLIAAARIGSTRLIDNHPVSPRKANLR